MIFEEANKMFKEINIDLSKEDYNKFELYKKLLLEWNKKINLTAITDDNDIWIKHFIDSCTIEKYIKDNSEIIDVGTGAGFPSLPLAIINDSIRVTLLDSLNKRISFLKEVCSSLKIQEVSFVHGRAEDFGNDSCYREKFDIVTARAVANMATLSEYCLPFVKIGGSFICMKASNIEAEINSSKKAIETLGGKIEKVDTFLLPDSKIERTIIIIKKIKCTPKTYPRKAGVPTKNPIL